MKKLFPIYGHTNPLNITPFNGTNKNASAKSITLSQQFKDLTFSLAVINTGINSPLRYSLPAISGNKQNDNLFVRSIPFPRVNEFSVITEKYRRSLSELKVAVLNRKKIFSKSKSGSINNSDSTNTSLAKLSTPEIYISGHRSKYGKLSSLSTLRNNYQNTF